MSDIQVMKHPRAGRNVVEFYVVDHDGEVFVATTWNIGVHKVDNRIKNILVPCVNTPDWIVDRLNQHLIERLLT